MPSRALLMSPQLEDGPAQLELEHHSSNSELVRDAIIGLADGLTVPFALTAGLSS